jgi:hypothetical protein
MEGAAMLECLDPTNASRTVATGILFTLLFAVFGAASAGASMRDLAGRHQALASSPAHGTRHVDWEKMYAGRNRGNDPRTNGNPSAEEKQNLQKRYKEWQSLPPEKKELLRRRMDQYRSMPPGERKLYEERYRQWRQLPPEERRRIENNLQRWDKLTPAERDAIRKRFGK